MSEPTETTVAPADELESLQALLRSAEQARDEEC